MIKRVVFCIKDSEKQSKYIRYCYSKKGMRCASWACKGWAGGVLPWAWHHSLTTFDRNYFYNLTLSKMVKFISAEWLNFS